MTPSTSSCDLGAEVGAQVVELRLGVLDDVVQERGRDRLLVEVELGTDPRDAPRVVDELLAGAAHLAPVARLGDLERPADQVAVDVRVVRLDAREQLLDEVLVVPLGVDDRHGLSVRTPTLRSPPFAAGDARPPVRKGAAMRLVQAYLERRRLLRMMQLLPPRRSRSPDATGAATRRIGSAA